MGHRKRSAPRRGSLGVRPRKRAESIIPRVRSWPVWITNEPRILGFVGYKVGMTHLMVVDDRPGSPTEGKEIFMPVTIIETPPMLAVALRLYKYDGNRGLQALTEAWVGKRELEKYHDVYLERLIKGISLPESTKHSLSRLEKYEDKAAEARLLALSRPIMAGGLSQKKPILVEIGIAGDDVQSKISMLKDILGQTINVENVFEAGKFIDVIGITKGKGFQGVIKRFGVKELPRWHKHRKASRTVGSRGSRVGALSSTPQAGQMGFHQRTEYNKRIIYIGSIDKLLNQAGQGKEADSKNIAREILSKINPSSGWHKYGLIKSDFIVVAGSVQGTRKRPLILRYPIRKTPWEPESAPRITYSYSMQIPL